MQYQTIESVSFQGWLEKQGKLKTWSWKKYWFVLDDDQLKYYKDEKCTAGQGLIDIAQAQYIKTYPSKTHGFQLEISTSSRLHVLSASSAELRDSWVRQLQRAMLLRRRFSRDHDFVRPSCDSISDEDNYQLEEMCDNSGHKKKATQVHGEEDQSALNPYATSDSVKQTVSSGSSSTSSSSDTPNRKVVHRLATSHPANKSLRGLSEPAYASVGDGDEPGYSVVEMSPSKNVQRTSCENAYSVVQKSGKSPSSMQRASAEPSYSVVHKGPNKSAKSSNALQRVSKEPAYSAVQVSPSKSGKNVSAVQRASADPTYDVVEDIPDSPKRQTKPFQATAQKSSSKDGNSVDFTDDEVFIDNPVYDTIAPVENTTTRRKMQAPPEPPPRDHPVGRNSKSPDAPKVKPKPLPRSSLNDRRSGSKDVVKVPPKTPPRISSIEHRSKSVDEIDGITFDFPAVPTLPHPRLELTWGSAFDDIRGFLANNRGPGEIYTPPVKSDKGGVENEAIQKLKQFLAQS